MLFVSKTASFVTRAFISTLVIATFALWVTEAQASAAGGGTGGGGGSSSGGGGGGGNGGDHGGGNGSSNDTVSRDSGGIDDIPPGYVATDDICLGGKFDKCD